MSMKTVTLAIDGQQVTAPEGQSVLWAALDSGVYIPNLCSLRGDAEPMAACRLCFVEIAGEGQPVAACTETVAEGMEVNTRGESALKLSRSGFRLLMASHPVDCGHCARNRTCELQKIARHLGTTLRPRHLRHLTRGLPVDNSHPGVVYDPNKCVLCGRCVRSCPQYAGILGFAHRGFNRIVTTFGDRPLGESACDGCPACAGVCPTGALVARDSGPTTA
jgi:formate dehydrogenase major subunit/NADH-quinone oxidoreductase subunit G